MDTVKAMETLGASYGIVENIPAIEAVEVMELMAVMPQ